VSVQLHVRLSYLSKHCEETTKVYPDINTTAVGTTGITYHITIDQFGRKLVRGAELSFSVMELNYRPNGSVRHSNLFCDCPLFYFFD